MRGFFTLRREMAINLNLRPALVLSFKGVVSNNAQFTLAATIATNNLLVPKHA